MKEILIQEINKCKSLFRNNCRTVVYKIVIATLVICVITLIGIYFALGIDYVVVSIIPALLVSIQVSCFINIIAYVCKIFIKRLKKQNRRFKEDMYLLKKELGKVAK